MASLARNMPELVTGQALTVYGDLTALTGWLMFNLGDHKAARYYYDDARAAGYRAGNNDLVAYTLSAASQLAAVRQRVRQAVDSLKQAGYNATGFVSENTAHEFLTWRRSLYQLAPLLFRNK